MKNCHLAFAIVLMSAACFGVQAQDNSKKLPAENYQNKIAEMQKSIAGLREEIARTRAERNNLQLKMEQSDQAIASQLKKINTIESSLAENKKTIEALETEKKS